MASRNLSQPSPHSEPTQRYDAAARIDAGRRTIVAAEQHRRMEFWRRECGMPDTITKWEEANIWAHHKQDLEDAEEARRSEERRELDAEVKGRLRERVLSAGFTEADLAHPDAPIPRCFILATDPRLPALKTAEDEYTLDEAAKRVALGAKESEEPTYDTDRCVQTLREPVPERAHSDDFHSVRWYGTQYTFTQNQAACIRVLWDNWERGTPDVGGQTLLVAAESDSSRFDLVFRNHPAWRTMIVSGPTKGTYRLQEPQATSAANAPRVRAVDERPRKKVGRTVKRRA